MPPTMLTHYRRRRGLYTVAPRPAVSRRLIATAVFFIAFFYFFGGSVVRLFGFGGPIERLPATLIVEDRGPVNVTLDGGDTKRAENQMKIFAGEKIATSGNGFASLLFFDGSAARLDQNAAVTVKESTREKKGIHLELTLERGNLWVLLPKSDASVDEQDTVRTVRTPLFTFSLPPGTDAVLSPSSLSVLHAPGLGVRVTAPKHDPVMVGEGQQLVLPDGVAAKDVDRDLYAYRSPLATDSHQRLFSNESRILLASVTTTSTTTATGTEILTVRTPRDGETVAQGTVAVAGTVGPRVASVTVNGHEAPLDADARTFAQDVSIPEGQTSFALRIQALDAEGSPLEEVQRTVSRKAATVAAGAIPSPIITSPAKTGETYRSDLVEMIIRGTSPTEAAAIYVNGYKLQLFTPSKGTWSYLASVQLGNLKPGTNTYDVIAEDKDGRRSESARVTVVHGEGETAMGGDDAQLASSSTAPDLGSLPKNDPLRPGTLKLGGAAASLGFVATGTGFLLEGTTSPDTASVWVNDYKLQLYQAGKTTWNYIASPGLKTLKVGNNVFIIVTRNGEGKILDRMEVKVEYR